jgi:hypothetical protein
MPAHVVAEARRGVVKMPSGSLTPRQTAELLAKVRKSELRKHRALNGALVYHERQRQRRD